MGGRKQVHMGGRKQAHMGGRKQAHLGSRKQVLKQQAAQARKRRRGILQASRIMDKARAAGHIGRDRISGF